MAFTNGGPSASHVSLSVGNLGEVRGATPPAGSIETADELLQKNHDKYHIFFREPSFHNHLAHNVLTRLALGASPSELQKSFDYDQVRQRAPPERDETVIKNLEDDAYFIERIGIQSQYANFLAFFERQIELKGYRSVVYEYVLSRSQIADSLLALMYDGLYHSLIHLGLGIEFNQPSIVAEALAQAAIHPSLDTEWFFHAAENLAEKTGAAADTSEKTLVELVDQVRSNEAIRRAGLTPGIIATFKQKDLVFKGDSGEALVALAAQWRVQPSTLERKTAEMISTCAYMAGAAQRPGKERRIDFFVMHSVTSSIFLTILNRQEWIDVDTKVRLVEWKARLDLAWYATIGAPELHIEDVEDYKGQTSGDMDWSTLFRTMNEFDSDDGHVAKFARALKNGEDVAKPFEEGPDSKAFPIKAGSWLKLARMAHDSTIGYGYGAKWVMMAGMDAAWK
jgi:hypothetical protein